jgi:hypothetical protein
MSEQTVFYEVATLDVAFTDPSFALIRIDAAKRMGSGVEGIVVSRHWTKPEAEAAAKLARTDAQPEHGGE